MAWTEDEIPVGSTGKALRSIEQTTAASPTQPVQVEVMALTDPTDPTKVQGVMTSTPVGTEAGALVRVVGPVNLAVEPTIDIGKVDQGTGGTSAWKVDGSSVTQPISGSVSVSNFPATQPVSGTVTANAGSGTFAVSGPLTDAQLRATPVPVSGTVTATPTGTQDTNTKQVNGATVDVGTGAAGTGTQRVAVASDSSVNAVQSGTWTVQPGNTANTTAWKVDNSAVTQPTNITQLGGNSINLGSGNAGTGTQRVIIATDQPSFNNAVPIEPKTTSFADTDSLNNTINLPINTSAAATIPIIYPHYFNGSSWDRMRGGTNGAFMQGNVASDAAVTANPLLNGGRASAATPTAVSTDGDSVALWLTLNGAVKTDPVGTTTQPVSISPPTAVKYGQTTVTTAGTAVQMSSNALTKGTVIIKAMAANTGKMYIGDSSVTSSNGYELSAGDVTSINVDNTNKIYVNSSVNGEKVSFLAS